MSTYNNVLIYFFKGDITMKITHTVLFIILTLCQVLAEETDMCPSIKTSKVGEIFKSDNVNIISADSSGTCFWHLNNQGDSLMTNVIKHPSVKQASELFKTYERTIFPKFTNHISYPQIGDKAFLGMKKDIVTLPSGEKVKEVHINLIVLEKDTIYTFSYDLADNSNINTRTIERLKKIGHISLSNSTKIKQGFGKCSWFLAGELDKLMGKKGQIVQSLGEERCIVYTKPGDAVLTAMGDSMEKSTFTLMKSIYKETCKVQELPQVGKSVYAYYDCPAPSNGVMNLELLKNGHHMAVTYQPNGRRTNIKDIDDMETLLKHIVKKL